MTTTLHERSGVPGRAGDGRRPEPPDFLSACPATGARRCWTGCGRPSTPTSTRAATSTSTTPARPAGPGAAGRACRADPRRVLRQPALGEPGLGRLDRTDRAGPARGAGALQRAAGGVRGDLHRECHRRVPADRGGLSVRPADPAGPDADNHNSVNGIREFARARGAAHPVHAVRLARAAGRRRHDPPGPGPAPAGPAGRGLAGGALRGGAVGRPGLARPAAAVAGRGGDQGRGGRWPRCPQGPSLAAAGCWPTRRRATSAGCSIRCAGSRRRTSTAMTCCWTRRRTCRRTGWTCRWSSPISCRSAGTRCSATRPASAA